MQMSTLTLGMTLKWWVHYCGTVLQLSECHPTCSVAFLLLRCKYLVITDFKGGYFWALVWCVPQVDWPVWSCHAGPERPQSWDPTKMLQKFQVHFFETFNFAQLWTFASLCPMCKIVQNVYNTMHHSDTIMQNGEMTVFLMLFSFLDMYYVSKHTPKEEFLLGCNKFICYNFSYVWFPICCFQDWLWTGLNCKLVWTGLVTTKNCIKPLWTS